MNRRIELLPVAIAATLLLPACAGNAPEPDANLSTIDPAPELASTLSVTVEDDSVHLVLRVTNATAETIHLEFASGQRADFVVEGPGGEEVWRWSQDRGFTQALGTEHVAPGETLTYEATWNPGSRRGRFEAVGYLTARERDLRRRVPFELPSP